MKRVITFTLALVLLSTLWMKTTNPKAAKATDAKSTAGLASASDAVGLYDTHEITYQITNNIPATDDDKTAVEFKATFTGPANEELILPGFWAGGNEWKLRFAPISLGEWTWVTDSDHQDLDGLTGSLTAVPSDNKGFVIVRDNNPYHFSYSDGSPYYMWGNTAYMLLEQALEGPGVSYVYTNPEDPNITHTITTHDWHEFVDKTGEYGMNKIRFLVTLWNWGANFGHRWYPWEDCTVADPKFTAFNQSYWEKLDEIVQYMQEKGMVAELLVISDYSNWAPGDPGMYYMTQADEERLMKFAIARYAGYSNVIWTVAQEFYYTERYRLGGRVNNQWARDLGNYMADTDPYRYGAGRLLSIHNRTQWLFNFPTEDWPTHIDLQVGPRITPVSYRAHPSLWGNESVLRNWGYDKPVVNDEYGYADNADLSRAGVREAAWGIAVGGGYGTYGEWNTDFYWDPWALNTGGLLGFWNDDPSQGDIKIMLDFMQGIDYLSMLHQNSLITDKPADVLAYMLAEEGKTYVMYAAEGTGGDFTIQLKKGTYFAWWYDTTTGNVVQTEPRIDLDGDEEVTFVSPTYADDIVLKITVGTRILMPMLQR